MSITLLGIESSCDDTSAAIIRDGVLLSTVIAGQDVHRQYGGVVPELASRAHQQNIVPVVKVAMDQAGVKSAEISAVAFTRGPGLLGSLLVGTSFAKGFALATSIPLVEVHHLKAHILAHFIRQEGVEMTYPQFPFLCLVVSGGHTQLVVVRDYLDMQIIGQTIDDAAGEAFDKCAKVLGLPYPGGPVIDKLAKTGDAHAFSFSKPQIPGLDFSFSGLKTSFLYLLRDRMAVDNRFKEERLADLAASLQNTIIEILIEKTVNAAKQTGISQIAIAGGVAANSGLREALTAEARQRNWTLHLPQIRFTTDNAAMIAIAGYYLFQAGIFSSHDIEPMARMEF